MAVVPINPADAYAEYAGLYESPESNEGERAKSKSNGASTDEPAIRLRPIHEIVAEQREPEWLIHKVIERNVLAVIAGPRSTFKSFIALDWAMRMALDGHTGVILSGEGAGLDRRVDAWIRHHRENLDLTTVPLVALEHALNLSLPVQLELLSSAIMDLPQRAAFILIDTLSKFSAGMDENDNGEVAAFLAALTSSLRERFACTVLLVAHSGHGDAKRPRGASSLMCNPDVEYIVTRPDPSGMTVTVSRDRFKDAPSMQPLAYEAKVIELGRVDRYGEAITSLALASTELPGSPTTARYRGRNQEKLVVALKEWHRSNPVAMHISSIDLDAICKTQKFDRKRRREVLDSFVNAQILSPSIGGYAIHPEHL